MEFRCPHCAATVSRWETFRFMRLASVPCPHCRNFVSLDQYGRLSLWIGVLVGVLASLTAAVFEIEAFAGLALFLAGVLSDAWIVPRAGHLIPSSEG